MKTKTYPIKLKKRYDVIRMTSKYHIDRDREEIVFESGDKITFQCIHGLFQAIVEISGW